MRGTVSQFDQLTHKLDTFVAGEQRRCYRLKKAVRTFAPMLDEKDAQAALGTLSGKRVKWKPQRCASRLHELSQQKQHLVEQEKALQTHIANMREYLSTLRGKLEEETHHREEAEAEAEDMMGEMDRIRELLYGESDGSTTDSSSSPRTSPQPSTGSGLTRRSTLRQSLLKVMESPTARRKSLRKTLTSSPSSPKTHEHHVRKSPPPMSNSRSPPSAKRTTPAAGPHPPAIVPRSPKAEGNRDKENAPGETSPKRAHISASNTHDSRISSAPPAHTTSHAPGTENMSPSVATLKQRFEHAHSPSPHHQQQQQQQQQQQYTPTGGSNPRPVATSPPQRSYAPSPLRVVQSPGKTPTSHGKPHTGAKSPKQHWQPTVLAQCTQTSPARASAPPSPPKKTPSPAKGALSPGEDRYNPTRTSPRGPSAPLSPPRQSPAPASRRALPHFFHTHTAFLRQACQQCHGTILYLNKYRKCSTCSFVCHVECEDSCPLDCGVLPSNRAHRQSLDLSAATGPGYDIPKLLTSCFQCIEERWLHAQGLYRHAGSSYEHKGVDLIHRFLRGRTEPNLRCINDPHEITTCIKLFLADLNEPLLTSRRHDNFVHAVVHNSGDRRFDAVSAVVETLPRINFFTLKCIMDHLNKVSAHSSYNSATRDVLVVELAPCLMRLRHNKQENQAMKPEEEVVDALLSLHQSHWSRAEKTVLELDARNPGERARLSPKSSIKSSSSSGSSRSPFRNWFSRR